jgi:hypothetical protein
MQHGMQPQRAVLDETAFRELVAGRVVRLRVPAVELVLADIGWATMLRAVLDAMAPPLDPPEAREFLPRRRGRPGK